MLLRLAVISVLSAVLAACAATPPGSVTASTPPPSAAVAAPIRNATPSPSPTFGVIRPIAPTAGALPPGKACEGEAVYPPLPVAVTSAIVRCVIREQAGSEPSGSVHRFYRTLDGRLLYVFESPTRPDPQTRIATERTDGEVAVGGQRFTWRYFEPKPGAPFPPEMYIAGQIRTQWVELALQVPEGVTKEDALSTLRGVVQGMLAQ